MRRRLSLCSVLLLLHAAALLSPAQAAQQQPAKGVFETCPACRLSAMPELKRFLHESVLKQEYGDRLSVKFIFGKTPTLLLYDDAGTQISATEVDARLKFDELHTWVQDMGFVKQPAAAAAEAAGASAAAVDPAAGATSTTAAAAADPTATAGAGVASALTPSLSAGAATPAAAAADAPIGPAPVPLQPEQLVQQQKQQQRRRRRRRHVRGAGAAAAGGGGGPQHQQRRRRQRQQQGEEGTPGNLYL